MTTLLPLVVVASIGLVPRLATSRLSIRHREHWLAPQRRAATHGDARRHGPARSAWCLIAVPHGHPLPHARSERAHAGAPDEGTFFAVLGGFLVVLVAWIAFIGLPLRAARASEPMAAKKSFLLRIDPALVGRGRAARAGRASQRQCAGRVPAARCARAARRATRSRVPRRKDDAGGDGRVASRGPVRANTRRRNAPTAATSSIIGGVLHRVLVPLDVPAAAHERLARRLRPREAHDGIVRAVRHEDRHVAVRGATPPRQRVGAR